MRTIGLLGGMSWESSLSYYQAINQGVKQRLGGLHSAKLVMVSLDFAEIERMQICGDWDAMAEVLANSASQLQAAGAEGFLICTNTMHKVSQEIQAAVDIPLLHIAVATAQDLVRDGLVKVGLLGTAFTMEQQFYIGRLREQGLQVVVPDEEGRALVHRVIYEELCLGLIHEASRNAYLSIIDDLVADGAQAVVLGCTEIGLLLQQEHTRVPIYDTTAIHAQAALDFMLGH